ncbi:MAG: universal stress protein [SAR202 cluster bacterium]|nr:universal stress protein [SAR202 cluster bacterium]
MPRFTTIVLGDPAKELIESAKRHQADFILVAKRHNLAVRPHLLGHVAARVARYAPV